MFHQKHVQIYQATTHYILIFIILTSFKFPTHNTPFTYPISTNLQCTDDLGRTYLLHDKWWKCGTSNFLLRPANNFTVIRTMSGSKNQKEFTFQVCLSDTGQLNWWQVLTMSTPNWPYMLSCCRYPTPTFCATEKNDNPTKFSLKAYWNMWTWAAAECALTAE